MFNRAMMGLDYIDAPDIMTRSKVFILNNMGSIASHYYRLNQESIHTFGSLCRLEGKSKPTSYFCSFST